MRSLFRSLFVFMIGMGSALTSAFAVPATVVYTGELMAENGLPYTGVVGVAVRVYGGMSGGEALATENLGEILIQNGVLEAPLMGLGGLTSNSGLWLEFEIDGETLSPRQQITSVAFSHRAASADTLGGLPASSFLQAQGTVQPAQLPTNGIAQISNNTLSNEFANVDWMWSGGPSPIFDVPGPPTLANITTNETGSTYLTSIAIYTQFSLTANTRLTMVLSPPVGTGVAPITLINDSAVITAGVYAHSWTPGNTPQLAPLIGAEVKGQWTLTIIDTSDDLIGTTATGSLDTFSVSYDVVRSDELDVNGRLNVMGNLEVGGQISGEGGGPANLAPGSTINGDPILSVSQSEYEALKAAVAVLENHKLTPSVSNQPSNSTVHTIYFPPNVNAGDLLLLFFGTDGAEALAITAPGFTSLGRQYHASAVLEIFAKIADGTEGNSFVVTTGVAEISTSLMYRVKGHTGLDGVATAFATIATANTTSDPPPITPSWGPAPRTLYFAVSMTQNEIILTDGAFGDYTAIGGGSQIRTAASYQISQVTTMDPPPFNLAVAGLWSAATVAVRLDY